MWSSRIIPSTPYRGNTSQAIRCLPTTTVIHVGVAGQSGAGRSIHEERVTFQSLLRQSPYLFYRPPPCRRVTRVGIFPPSPEKDFKREVWQGNKVGLWVERDDMLSERLVSSVCYLSGLSHPQGRTVQTWTHQQEGGLSSFLVCGWFVVITVLVLCVEGTLLQILIFPVSVYVSWMLDFNDTGK